MANELITREDILTGKQNFDAFSKYLQGSSSEQVRLPNGKLIKTLSAVQKEIKDSFEDGTVARLSPGTAVGQVPLAQDTYKASNTGVDFRIHIDDATNADCNNFLVGTRGFVPRSVKNTPIGSDLSYFIETRSTNTLERLLQIAWGYNTGEIFTRVFSGESWTAWSHSSATKSTYSTTTATAANVVVTSTGELQRSTSSRVFKDDIKPIEIDDYRTALRSVQPVSYRSKYTADNPKWTWYSFIAEDMVNVDPRLVQMSDVEFFEDTDEDGNKFVNSRQLPEGEYAPSGLNFNGIVTLMARINQYMLDDIEALEAEKTQLKSRMTKLEKRLEALESKSNQA